MGDDYGLYQHVQTSSKRQQGHAAEERLRRAQLALAMKATKESVCAQGPPDAYPYRNPGQKLGSQSGSNGSSSLASQLKEEVKGSLESLSSQRGRVEAAKQRQQAQMLSDMFKAVWPDLGSFRSWGTATKVASMSGSLSLSLAFFGLVWYISRDSEKTSVGTHGAEDAQGTKY
ncbi:hypothetical protein HaLaN_04643 [Haematococcus lacustris]|uniref:Uncharacterized protein n=1 Tax=Haematococcus lacustris TaxID=44745 RepID=A0A699YT21_HAELA|nr:hypothetical protein HaLaN_04643 [Haematococcus lacustris]